MLHLLAQYVFLLVLADFAGDFAGYLVFYLDPLHFVGQMHINFFKPLQRINRLQQLLQISHGQVYIQRHQVRQPGRVVDVINHFHYIVRQGLAIGERDLEQGIQALHQGIRHQVLFHKLPHNLAVGQGDLAGGFHINYA